MRHDDVVQFPMKGISLGVKVRVQTLRSLLGLHHGRLLEGLVQLCERNLTPSQRVAYTHMLRHRMADASSAGAGVRVADLPPLEFPLGFELGDDELVLPSKDT